MLTFRQVKFAHAIVLQVARVLRYSLAEVVGIYLSCSFFCILILFVYGVSFTYGVIFSFQARWLYEESTKHLPFTASLWKDVSSVLRKFISLLLNFKVFSGRHIICVLIFHFFPIFLLQNEQYHLLYPMPYISYCLVCNV